jgi:hypothetical protein
MPEPSFSQMFTPGILEKISSIIKAVDAGEPHYFIFFTRKSVLFLISGKRSDFVFLGLLKR